MAWQMAWRGKSPDQRSYCSLLVFFARAPPLSLAALPLAARRSPLAARRTPHAPRRSPLAPALVSRACILPCLKGKIRDRPQSESRRN